MNSLVDNGNSFNENFKILEKRINNFPRIPNNFLISSKVNSAYLPSYVDDVLEFIDFPSLPTIGETGKIYLTTSDNKQYRWSGSTYISIGGANAGGNDTQIQFNNAGNFSGVSELSWDNTAKLLNVNSLKIGLGPGNIATNLLIGDNSFIANTTGYNNIVVGANSLYKNTTGYRNIAIGAECLKENLTARGLIAIGFNCLPNVTVEKNTAIGSGSGWSITTGGYNTCIGSEAGWNISTGAFNIAIGYQTLDGAGANSTASYNVAVGTQSLYSHTTGGNNTALGYRAGFGVITASSNIFIGNNTGQGITSGNYNTVIGANISALPATLNNTIIIGDGQGNKRIVVFSNGNMIIGAGTALPTDEGFGLHANSIKSYGDCLFDNDVTVTNNLLANNISSNNLTATNIIEANIWETVPDYKASIMLSGNTGINFLGGIVGADLEINGGLPQTIYYVANGNGGAINSEGFWYKDSTNNWNKM